MKKRVICLVLLCVGMFSGMAVAGTPEDPTWWECVVDNVAIAFDSYNKFLTAREEIDLINENWDKYENGSHSSSWFSVVGVDGEYPVFEYEVGDTGPYALTYLTIDNAGNPFTDPLVDSVQYYYLNMETITIDYTDRALLTGFVQDIGNWDIVTNHAAFNITGFEPMIWAIAYDDTEADLGEQYYGAASFVEVPEPASLVLLSFGILPLLKRRRT